MRFLTVLLCAAPLVAAIDPPVKLDSGMVSGSAGTDPDVRVIKGIPFAAPPEGNMRWRAPQPVAHWDGIRKTDEFGPMCMQAPGRGGASLDDRLRPSPHTRARRDECRPSCWRSFVSQPILLLASSPAVQ